MNITSDSIFVLQIWDLKKIQEKLQYCVCQSVFIFTGKYRNLFRWQSLRKIYWKEKRMHNVIVLVGQK